MKYEFIKLGMDDYVLKYKDKELKFSSKVEYMNDVQNAIKLARVQMVKDLAKEGLTVKSLIKEEVKDGKTYYDNSNKDFMEKAYLEDAQTEVFNNVIKKMFGKDMEELAAEIGLYTEQEVNKFGEEVGAILTGRFQGRTRNQEEK